MRPVTRPMGYEFKRRVLDRVAERLAPATAASGPPGHPPGLFFSPPEKNHAPCLTPGWVRVK